MTEFCCSGCLPARKENRRHDVRSRKGLKCLNDFNNVVKQFNSNCFIGSLYTIKKKRILL